MLLVRIGNSAQDAALYWSVNTRINTGGGALNLNSLMEVWILL